MIDGMIEVAVVTAILFICWVFCGNLQKPSNTFIGGYVVLAVIGLLAGEGWYALCYGLIAAIIQLYVRTRGGEVEQVE